MVCRRRRLASKSCHILDKHDPSWRFVHELTIAAPVRQLRVLALNCPNAKIATYVRDTLLAEQADPSDRVNAARAADDRASGGELGRLGDALARHDAELLDRISDLTPEERMRVGGLDKYLGQIATQLDSRDFARAAELLDLSVERTVEFARLPEPSLVSYLRTRPPAEEAAAIRRADLIARAPDHVHPDPLVVFPSLSDPAKLAPVLTGKTLELLINHSDPNVVVRAISEPPALAVAEKLLADSPELLDRLPRYRHMTKAGRAGVDDLAKPAKDDLADELHDVKHNKTDSAERGLAGGYEVSRGRPAQARRRPREAAG